MSSSFISPLFPVCARLVLWAKVGWMKRTTARR
jgi:hypothetical protein